jgi:hypothetical protein
MVGEGLLTSGVPVQSPEVTEGVTGLYNELTLKITYSPSNPLIRDG